MSSDIKTGDEVVCINVTPVPGMVNPRVLDLIQLNQVYTVLQVLPHPWPAYRDTIMVALNEVTAINDQGQRTRPIFLIKRFRKVQKKFKGMEVLNGLLLNPAKELEHAD